MAKRKITDQVQINVRMREALRAKLEQSAKKNYESLNREIVDRLERSFDRQDL
jgi:predicted HicB family RNase H-like nuclease